MAQLAYSDAPLSSTGGLVSRKIVRVSPVGPRQMYDLEVSHPKHNYTLPNGVITSNSHAICYSIIGYACAYLKHYFPMEWWCAVLQNADRNEIDTTFWSHCRDFVDLPDIKLSQDNFTIVNGRIRAPLRLMNGIGEQAHKELIECRPFDDLDGFFQKIYDRRVRLGEEVTEKKTSKKGVVTEVKKLKLARSALNKTLFSKLVVSGVADSLFPPGLSLDNKLALLNETKARIEGAKKVAPADPRFIGLSPLQVFQLQKSILPTFTEDLLPKVSHLFDKDELQWTGRHYNWKLARMFEGNDWCPVASGSAAKDWLDLNGSLSGATITPHFQFAVVAYIGEVEWFWQGKAARVNYEVDGERFSSVLWPKKDDQNKGKKAVLPKGFGKGCVALLTLTRYNCDKQFVLNEIRVIEPELVLKPTSEEQT